MSEYRAGLEAAGFGEIAIEPTHEVADGMHSAIVRARKLPERAAERLPVVAAAGGGCCG